MKSYPLPSIYIVHDPVLLKQIQARARIREAIRTITPLMQELANGWIAVGTAAHHSDLAISSAVRSLNVGKKYFSHLRHSDSESHR